MTETVVEEEAQVVMGGGDGAEKQSLISNRDSILDLNLSPSLRWTSMGPYGPGQELLAGPIKRSIGPL